MTQHQHDTLMSANGSQSHEYRGVPIWTLVAPDNAGASEHKQGEMLDSYVRVRAKDGYQVVYSVGEINPAFGHSGALIGARADGAAAAIAASVLYSTAPQDKKGGRYVADVDSVVLLHARTSDVDGHAHAAGEVAVTGALKHPFTLDLHMLSAFPTVR